MGSQTAVDHHHLQSLLNLLQINSPPQTLDEFLRHYDNTISEDDSDGNTRSKHLVMEETKLEKEIISTILSGNTAVLRPNSGQAVTLGDEHHICVGFHFDNASDYRVWEWHGHLMLFDEQNGYVPEYVYGNYFEKLKGVHRSVEIDEEARNDVFGLKELIETPDSNPRILHRRLVASVGKFVP